MTSEQLIAHFDRLSEAPDAIPQLRKFILDIAVTGKLIEQSQSYEPASILVSRIEAERERALKAGEFKKLESFAPISIEELPFPVPSGWEIRRMGWIASKLGAGSTPLGGKSVYNADGIPFLRSQNVYDDGLRLDDVALIPHSVHEKMSGTHVRKNDILLNITGASIGRCALVPDDFKEGNVSQHVAIIRLFFPAIRDFVHLSLTSPFYQKLIDDVQVGVSREGLSMQRLRLFPMLIPPMAEQEAIVSKVDELMALCDRLEAAQKKRETRRDTLVAASLHHLANDADPAAFRENARFYFNHLPRLTMRKEHVQELRHTSLTWAIRGQLVPQNAEDQPATELLKEIQQEKEKLLKNGRIKKIGSSAIPKSVDVPRPLPAGWALARLESLCISITDGDHLPPPKTKQGIPFLVIGNVRTQMINFNDCRYVGQQYYDSLDEFRRPAKGDLLYTLVGSYGIPVIVDGDRPFCVQRHIGILRPSRHISVSWLKWAMQSEWIFDQATTYATGIAQKTVPLSGLRRILIPVPPHKEQLRIVAKVDELMRLCNALERQTASADIENSRLLEAVLAQVTVANRSESANNRLQLVV